MDDQSIESSEDHANQIIQDFNPELNARVCVSFSMQRNLKDYESCHFSIRYEQNCRPEDRQKLTEILTQEAHSYILQRSAKVDDFLRKRHEKNKSQNQGSGSWQAPI